jgi:FkbM family methyltransferase
MTIANEIWTVAVKTRNRLKRAGMLGPLDGFSTYLGPRLLPPPSADVEVQLPLELELIVPAGYPSYRNFATGLYETDVTQLFMTHVSRGMTVIDLGANIGYYTLLASRLVGSEGRVFAFEPDLGAFKHLERNIARNRCSNVTAVNEAVADSMDAVSFVAAGPERGFVSDRRDSHVSVDSTSLDAFFERIGWPAVHLIKIDIEGSERRALSGMRELVRRNPTIQIIVELNLEAISRSGGTLARLVETLNQLGFFTGYLIEQHRQLPLTDLLPGSRAVHNLLLSGSAR